MYQDVEYKLAQYAQWCGNPLRALGYPKASSHAWGLPDAVDADALPEMSDEEAQMVGDALLALAKVNKPAHTAVTARFLGRISDDREIGRRYGLGSRVQVYQIRLRGYSALQMFFHRHHSVL